METRIGIDIGGTFTDLVYLTPEGGIRRAKVLSTPDDYARGIAEGLGASIASGEIDVAGVAQLMHGTTVATNAILEGKGAKVALITTDGFRDVLEIRRLRMPVLYDIRWRKPEPLVPRRLRFEVPERVDHLGAVERPLDETVARAVVEQVLASGVEAIAICLLNAYANGAHERRLRAIIRERDSEIPVTLSSELLPEIKEYERSSTSVVNAYVMPVVRRYLQRLEAELRARKIAKPLTIMQSSGGAMSAQSAAERPIHIIESGPAAGVVGAAEVARRLGRLSLLSFDMGGTTAKAALVDAGEFHRVGSLEVGGGINISGRLLSGGGYHVRAPAIDIAEVGAGGGSLVQLDAGGALKVGPESAGAAPGPVCYARGGTTPTVTDANVVLGFINPRALAGGTFPVRHDLAVAAIEQHVAKKLKLSVEEAAWGVHRVADAMMARAVRAVSTERGRDPRDFALLAFGGNGPVHAATIARLLDIKRILVPPVPGVFSALGMLFPDVEHHYVRTFKRVLGKADPALLEAEFAALEKDGAAALAEEGFAPADRRFERAIDLRYAGANSELTVPWPVSGDVAAELRAAFSKQHERQYGYSSADETIETMNLRVVARGVPKTARVPSRLSVAEEKAPPASSRHVYFGPERGWIDTPIITRMQLGANWRAGPLLVEEFDSTTVVPPDGRARRIDWDVIDVELA
ncbi:MAG: hydantoinase/oxoprolinase family protein [Alphaproteobacteria bacterium]|nr:hydantoinase/oxoprolinase family protein [Alphaproteobacteria bacterium]